MSAAATSADSHDAAVYRPAPAWPAGSGSADFGSADALAGWRTSSGEVLDQQPGQQPDRAEGATVAGGELRMTPARTAWLDRGHALGVARQVTGDVLVTERVLAAGRTTPQPATNWSLTGLMLREPRAERGPENWVHLSTGTVDAAAALQRKQTLGGHSALQVTSVPAGWTELRLVRSGPAVVLLHRPEGGAWTLDNTYAATRLPATVELLLTAQTGAEGGPPDLLAQVDWVHVAPSPLSPEAAAALAEGTATGANLLRQLSG